MSNRLYATLMTVVIIILVIAFFSLGYIIGYYHNDHQHDVGSRNVRCTGYTVLDADRVITCNNDTIDYKWNQQQR